MGRSAPRTLARPRRRSTRSVERGLADGEGIAGWLQRHRGGGGDDEDGGLFSLGHGNLNCAGGNVIEREELYLRCAVGKGDELQVPLLRDAARGADEAVGKPCLVQGFRVVVKVDFRDVDVVEGEAGLGVDFVGDVLEAEQDFLPGVGGQVDGFLHPTAAAVGVETVGVGAVAGVVFGVETLHIVGGEGLPGTAVSARLRAGVIL